MAKQQYNPKNCNLNFTQGTNYKDLRFLGGNVYRDIKMSLIMGTSSDVVHYLKTYSKLLDGFNGNEQVKLLSKGMFSVVYLLKDSDGKELVIKRSHDGWTPLQLYRNFYVPFPRFIVRIFMPDYGVSPVSLRRDVYDYEKVLRPHWSKKRCKLEGEKFFPYLNMGLHMVDSFLPIFTVRDLYTKRFWNKFLHQKSHRLLSKLQEYLRTVPSQTTLIPDEERYILYDKFTDSLQTIILQTAMRGKREVVKGKKMAFPYELVAEGRIPPEVPKVMIEHILRSIESFVRQLDYQQEIRKVPDFRPLESFKVFPPTPMELLFAETANLVAYKDKAGKVNISFVDTHLLLEPEGNIIYRWIEKRYWMSLFLNLRFWVKKALDAM